MKAHELLATPDRWTKGRFAADTSGHGVAPSNPEATCFCMLGALRRCYPALEEYLAIRKRLGKWLHETYGISSVVVFNDAEERTHSDVVNVLKELDL